MWLRALFFTPIILSVFALASACAAQFSDAENEADAVESADENAEINGVDTQMIVGGYGAGDVSEPGAQTAYGLAQDAIYTAHPTRALVDKVELETQVVAGLNYRFRIEMTGSQDARDIYSVTVYRDLEGTYTVTDLTKLQ